LQALAPSRARAASALRRQAPEPLVAARARSHVLTPLVNILLALAQVPLSFVLPAAAMRALFWARVVLLPLVRAARPAPACARAARCALGRRAPQQVVRRALPSSMALFWQGARWRAVDCVPAVCLCSGPLLGRVRAALHRINQGSR